MRSTLDLDHDVAAQILELQRGGGLPLSDVINDVLRRGLGLSATTVDTSRPAVSPPYRMPTRDLKMRADIDGDRIRDVITELDDERWG